MRVESHKPSIGAIVSVLVAAAALSGCGGDDAEKNPQNSAPAERPTASVSPTDVAQAAKPESVSAPDAVFWDAMNVLCGQAYAGALTIGTEPSDRDIGEADLTMHVAECDSDLLRIPFHVGDNRSRTWELRRAGDTLSLHHRHRHEDGSLDDITGYGGIACGGGDAQRQSFCADSRTGEMIPAASTNVWALEIHPGEMFAYELQREAEGRYFRVEFDLTQPVAPPPPPW